MAEISTKVAGGATFLCSPGILLKQSEKGSSERKFLGRLGGGGPAPLNTPMSHMRVELKTQLSSQVYSVQKLLMPLYMISEQ